MNDYYARNREKVLEYARRYNQKHRERLNEQARLKRKNEPEKMLLCAAKARAKKNGIPFNIDLSDIHIPKVCPIRNIPLVIADGRSNDNSPTLDKIDNALGYVKGNVAVISKLANTNKSNMSLDDVKRLLAYMERDI